MKSLTQIKYEVAHLDNAHDGMTFCDEVVKRYVGQFFEEILSRQKTYGGRKVVRVEDILEVKSNLK